ncbi:MAG: hypothetical protein KAJ93_02365 [Methanosarcinales archaeon]|nr:hypothetical protein [Methanosarcinales archaeon]
MTEGKRTVQFDPAKADANTVSAIKDYEDGKIDITELKARTVDSGITWWDSTTEIKYRPDDNSSREQGQTYHPFNHKNGMFWQGLIKPTIQMLLEKVSKNTWVMKTPMFPRVIKFIHDKMKSNYYDDIFEHTDERLIFIEQFMKSYIDIEFMNGYPKKHIFMNQIVDIIIALCKEDIYYRTRFIDFINKFVRLCNAKYPMAENEGQQAGGIPLTQKEMENLLKWH